VRSAEKPDRSSATPTAIPLQAPKGQPNGTTIPEGLVYNLKMMRIYRCSSIRKLQHGNWLPSLHCRNTDGHPFIALFY